MSNRPGLERTVKTEPVNTEINSIERAYIKIETKEKCELCGYKKTNRTYSPCKDCGKTICGDSMTEDEYGAKICYICHNQK